jgi:hypothetical protein
MPWSAADAHKKTHAANTVTKQHAWAAQANAILKKTGDEALAIRVANKNVRKS